MERAREKKNRGLQLSRTVQCRMVGEAVPRWTCLMQRATRTKGERLKNYIHAVGAPKVHKQARVTLSNQTAGQVDRNGSPR